MRRIMHGLAMMNCIGMASCAQKAAQQPEEASHFTRIVPQLAEAAVGEMAIQTFKK